MTVTVTVANSVPAGSLGAAFSSFSASGLFTLTGVEDTLTAHAGGTQAAALALSSTKNYHRISVCATANDSVALPPATVGQAHFVRNDGAASCQVYGTTPDTIDGVATATGIALPAGVGRWFICTTAAKWYTDDAATTTGSGANVLATSPALVTPALGTPASGVVTNLTGDKLGTTTNDSAAAGHVGERLSTNKVYNDSPVAVSNNTAVTVVSVALTAGEWLVEGSVGYNNTGVTATKYLAAISATDNTFPAEIQSSGLPLLLTAYTGTVHFPAPAVPVSLSGNATLYLIALCVFSGGTVTAYGDIRARRVR